MTRRFKTQRHGFTAIEIAMVASVIAILALLILPVFRQRAEDARRTAAQDELQSLTKALLLLEADMPGGNFLPMLSDLDNREDVGLTVSTTPQLEPARSKWIRNVFIDGRGAFVYEGESTLYTNSEYLQSVVPNFKGPYIALRNFASLTTIRDSFPRLTNGGANVGPITIPASFSAAQLDDEKYPIDPWGTPYLLFGPEETIYSVRSLYSLGPNGVPGNSSAPAAGDYNRRNGVLGTGDDLQFIF